MLEPPGDYETPSAKLFDKKIAEKFQNDLCVEDAFEPTGQSRLAKIVPQFGQYQDHCATRDFSIDRAVGSSCESKFQGSQRQFSAGNRSAECLGGVVDGKAIPQTAFENTEDEIAETHNALGPGEELLLEHELLLENTIHESDQVSDFDDEESSSNVLILRVEADPENKNADISSSRLESKFSSYTVDQTGQATKVQPSIASALLPDCHDLTREFAASARICAVSTVKSLPSPVRRAYAPPISAPELPKEFSAIIAEAGQVIHDLSRSDNKSRVTEYAAVLTLAHRAYSRRENLADYLKEADHVIKSLTGQGQMLRQLESEETATKADADPHSALAKQLRTLPPTPVADLPCGGEEFSLVLTRMLPDGEVVLLGQIPHDRPLIERAAQKLITNGGAAGKSIGNAALDRIFQT